MAATYTSQPQRYSKTAFCAALIGLLIICCIYYLPWLNGQASFYIFDIAVFFEPLLRFMSEAIRAGHLPLWNPYLLCGAPQAAIIHPGLFYPPNLLFAVLPFNQALGTAIVINHVVAFCAMYCLIAALGMGIAAATFVGVAFSLSGLLFSLSENYLLQATCAWLPVCTVLFLQLNSGARKYDYAGTVLAAIAYFMLLTAAVPEVWLPFSLFLVAWAIGRWYHHRSEDSARGILLLNAVALLLGILLAMPAILPAWEWATLSRRAAGLAPVELFHWSTTWYDLLGIVVAQPWGDTLEMDNKLRHLLPSYQSDTLYIQSCLLGPVIFTYALWGLSDRRWGARLSLIAVSVITCLLSMGNSVPLVPLLYKGLHLTMFRYPVKLLIFTIVSLVIAAGRGLWLQFNRITSRSIAAVTILWAALFACGLLLASGLLNSALFQVISPNDASPALQEIGAQSLGLALIIAGVLGLLTCLLAWLLKMNLLRTVVFLACTGALAAGSLLWPAFRFDRHFGAPDFYSSRVWAEDAVKKLGSVTMSGPLKRICYMMPENRVPAFMLKGSNKTFITGWYLRQMLFPLFNVDSRLGSTVLAASGEPKTIDDIVWPAVYEHVVHHNDKPLAVYLQMSSTQYVFDWLNQLDKRNQMVGPMPLLCQPFLKVVLEDKNMNARIYAVKDPLPRAFFAKKVAWGKPHDLVAQALARPDLSGFDPHKITILEHLPNDAPGQIVNLPARSSIVFSADNAEHVRLLVSTDRADYLILTDQFYPGWTAAIDGAPAEVFPANGFCRAVLVPAGNHRLDFLYRPKSVFAGLICAAAALLCCVGLLFAATRKKADSAAD